MRAYCKWPFGKMRMYSFQGNSGGPLVCMYRQRKTIIGVMKSLPAPTIEQIVTGDYNQLTMYATNVGEYKSWIEKNRELIKAPGNITLFN